uniref:Putative salivary lipocalin n=1 Tax=Panstrongylus lignarius TaxID=156445 RepID=A0A224XYZ7_9HEMI
MKMIIAMTFLGIVVHACAEECKLEPATNDYNSDKYFKIPEVYAVYSKNGKENVCRKYQTTTNSDGTTKTLVFEDGKNGGTPSKALLECINKPKSDKPGEFDVECKLPQVTEKGGTIKIQLETSVLDTDNEKYVVLQRCSQTTGSDIVVLQTYTTGLEQGVENYFDKKGWTFNQWYSRDQVDCNNIKN